ncbi:hypothetical protein O6H91_05G104500 [Diphasiastrum complanatum]|uniref:Uncharacterized protein n=1 Tax=Diphasiastrum complanatum TaxID=34168 RepID=A0ACC2DRJ9_DIPCM|nr:hypothetical protein O6H91_05G104500 [Diphasiastrum complanatum]
MLSLGRSNLMRGSLALSVFLSLFLKSSRRPVVYFDLVLGIHIMALNYWLHKMCRLLVWNHGLETISTAGQAVLRRATTSILWRCFAKRKNGRQDLRSTVLQQNAINLRGAK